VSAPHPTGTIDIGLHRHQYLSVEAKTATWPFHGFSITDFLPDFLTPTQSRVHPEISARKRTVVFS